MKVRLRSRLSEYPVYLDSSNEPVPWTEAVLAVPAGGTAPVRVEIVPDQRTGSAMVTSVFAWQDAKNAPRHEGLELGPVRLISPGLQFVSNSLETGMSLGETLALPVVIALLGWILQQIHQNHVQERQAWASMLPISHDNNINLYIPLISGITTFQGVLEAEKQGSDDADEAFFFLLFCFRRMREIDKGFYLMDRTGEKLVTDCWNEFQGKALEWLEPYEQLSLLLDIMSPDESFSRYRRKIQRRGLEAEGTKLQGKFQAWRVAARPDFDLLFLLCGLLDFEVNRIYKFWYGSLPEFPDCGEVLTRLEQGQPELVEAVRKYAKNFPKDSPQGVGDGGGAAAGTIRAS